MKNRLGFIKLSGRSSVYFLSLVTYLISSLLVLSNGMVHEDAYILFKYVNNLINFGSISYVPQLGPAEGATDFLWFISLSVLVYLGLLPGLAAIVLSLIGLFLIIYSGDRLLKSLHVETREYDYGFYIFVIGVTFSSISAAALGGFSTLFYCGFIALGFFYSFRGLVGATIWIGLLIGLIRPDGLIVSCGFLIVSMLMRNKSEPLPLAHFCGAVAIGLVYFCCRWAYFELPLPLPLMVKSHTAEPLDGLHDVLKVAKYIAPIFLFYFIFFRKNNSRGLVVLIPIVLFLVPLIFVHLSQNIAFRFQSPVVVISWLLFIVLYAKSSIDKKVYLYIALVPLVAFGARNYIQQFERLTKFEYINTLSPVIAKSLSGYSVALTEAGRLPYFSNAIFYDLVGLNNRQAATERVNTEVLSGWNPDFIFIHPVNALSVSSKCDRGYEKLSIDEITPNVDVRNNNDKVTQAAFAVYDFVNKVGGYDFYVARFDKRCNHFYFIKSDSGLVDDFDLALKYSIDPENRINYFSAEKYNISGSK